MERLSAARGITHTVLEKVAPTGVAANAIGGQTIHSLFRIPVNVNADIPELSVNEATNIRNRLRHVEYFIMDEKSMIGCRLLHFIDCRMRQIFESRLFFGGRSVVLIGDFFQLPPVKQLPLFSDESRLKATADFAGHAAYLQFTKTIELKQVLRQAGDDQAAFRAALEGLRNNTCTTAHWQTLSSRVQSILDQAEVDSFGEAIRIYPTRAQVVEYNQHHLEKIDSAIVNSRATNTGTDAHKTDASNAGNLHNVLPLCVGARVMLTENLWTTAGLVNGAAGYVWDIAWAAGVETPRETLPFVILVKMDSYTGRACFPDRPEIPRDVVPVFLVQREFLRGTVLCTRTQFPCTIAYAITVHKSQGATLAKAVLDISGRDFASGLTYVAVSRVTRLDGIMFSVSFCLADLRIKNDNVGLLRSKDYDRRLCAGQILKPSVEEGALSPPERSSSPFRLTSSFRDAFDAVGDAVQEDNVAVAGLREDEPERSPSPFRVSSSFDDALYEAASAVQESQPGPSASGM